jgi:hypothetical protein
MTRNFLLQKFLDWHICEKKAHLEVLSCYGKECFKKELESEFVEYLQGISHVLHSEDIETVRSWLWSCSDGKSLVDILYEIS